MHYTPSLNAQRLTIYCGITRMLKGGLHWLSWENSTRPRTLAQEAPGAYEAVIGYAQFVEPQGVPNMYIA